VITSQFQEGLKYNNLSIKLCKKSSKTEEYIAYNLLLMGASYSALNNFEKAYNTFYEALRVIQQVKLSPTAQHIIVEIYCKLGDLYLEYYTN
jgi:hypothetical protein